MTNDAAPAERWTKAYRAAAAARFYEDSGVLTEDEYFTLLEDTLRIRQLGLPGLDWLLFDHALSVYRQVPLLTHYEAAAQGLNLEFTGIEALYAELIDRELMPAWTLNRTALYRAPKGPGRIGELMLEAGLISEAALSVSLKVTDSIKSQLNVRPAIGQVFRTVARVSVCDFFQVLGIQVGIPYKSLDESASAIFEAAMGR